MKIDINDLTLGQIKELTQNISSKSAHPYEVGKAYFIRTVTMHHVGILKAVYDNELVFSDASWIPNSGRFHNFLKGDVIDEVEPFINDVIIGRNAIIDATLWDNPLPRNQK